MRAKTMVALRPLRPGILGLHAQNHPACTIRPQDLHNPCNAHTRYRSHHVQRSQSRDKTRCRPCQPVTDSHHDHHGLSSIGNLPQFAEEPDSVMSLSPLIGTEPSESSESSNSTTVRAESPQPLFIPPRYSRTPSPSPRHRRSRAVSPSSSSSSSPSSSDSEDSEDSDSRGGGPHHRHPHHRHQHHSSRKYRSPSHLHSQHRTSGGHQNNNNTSSPLRRHATRAFTGLLNTHLPLLVLFKPTPNTAPRKARPRLSLPPPQQPKPPRGTYRRSLRYGYWNRRGDYLTMDKYVVYAPHNRANPPELEGYPSPTDGYKDHYGNFVKYDPTRCELPESLPRQGQPPSLPYEKVGLVPPFPRRYFFLTTYILCVLLQFVTYVYL
jgi:hypothetical protein